MGLSELGLQGQGPTTGSGAVQCRGRERSERRDTRQVRAGKTNVM